MVLQLFGQSDTGQRAGILNQLIAAAGPAALSGGLLGNLTGALSGPRPTITPQQAQQVDPNALRQLADHAQQHDPSIVDRQASSTRSIRSSSKGSVPRRWHSLCRMSHRATEPLIGRSAAQERAL